ncbi:MAG: c-type cytochrome [Verrucomicrobiales bacterium]|nr:c-type cytochrome [Verrucomicrobiales bacterium]
MHYYGGDGPADYFGLFADRLAQKLESGDHKPVCAMSQGTSGDLHWMDYGQPNKGRNVSVYTDGLVTIAAQALKEIEYQNDPPLGMAEQTITLSRRLPDAERLRWADQLLGEMGKRRPKNRPEVYAEQARFIDENPTETLVLQALRIGDLAITALPNEVYSITGLKLKARSPFPDTFNIELANGAAGYIPPPHQHDLGGYTTWPARTAGLEVEAEPKIVDSLLGLLENLSGKARRDPQPQHGVYAQAILAEKPLAYWRCEEFEGGKLADASGKNRTGRIEGGIAYHLPGPEHTSFSGSARNAALQLAGGTATASIPEARSLSFWFWNGMDSAVRGNTGDLVQKNGEELRLKIGGHEDGKGRGRLILQGSGQKFAGSTELGLRSWHNVVISRDGGTVRVFLDGNPSPEIEAKVPAKTPTAKWRFGGELPIEGRIDEVAFFSRVLSAKDAERLYRASGMTAPPEPLPPPSIVKRGATNDYAGVVAATKPIAQWRLRDSARDAGPGAHHGTIEKGVQLEQAGDTFTSGRMRAEIEEIDDTYTVTFWFRNSLPNQSRPVTGYLFSRGVDGLKSADGDHLGIGGTHSSAGRLIVYHGNTTSKLLSGKSDLEPDSWHHVAMIREGERIRVHLNGNPKPEIDGRLPRSYPEQHPQFFFGGRSDNFANLKGRLDEVALFDRVLTSKEIAAHFRTVRLTPVSASAASLSAKSGKESEPLDPDDSIKSIHIRKGYRIELVAAEPLVQDPVAIDWSPDGKLWVAEMADYPLGLDGKGKPGGRVRVLEDTNDDGRYDKSTVFLEGLNFPTGVMTWQDGVLVTAAPKILFARDTDGDGKADEQRAVIDGFSEGNQQLRVNGLRRGLDNWIHCASGAHHGGYGKGNAVSMGENRLVLGSRDFRFRPDQGLIDPQSGPSQFGRNRDDWGNWFGVQNSMPVWHYVLHDHHLRRNPHFLSPSPKQLVLPRYSPVFPAKAPQERFHGFEQSGKFTSACSTSVYRDELLFPRGEERHVFTCEPFHNLVQHNVLRPDGVTFEGSREGSESDMDFVASKDRWFRPVMVRTGPDGALWIVDMYRYMIEHPQWLPEKGKDALRPFYRSGDDRGRIYRVIPEGKEPRDWSFSDRDLVEQLESPNGLVRDMAQQLLIQQERAASIKKLRDTIQKSGNALARLHALCALDGLGELRGPDLRFDDPHPGIRRESVRLAAAVDDLDVAELVSLTGDSAKPVQLELANTLGYIDDIRASEALAILAGSDDSWISAAAMTSLHAGNIDEVLSHAESQVLPGLLRQALALDRREAAESALTKFLKDASKPDGFNVVSEWLTARKIQSLDAIQAGPIREVAESAPAIAFDSRSDLQARLASIRLLHLFPDKPTKDLLASAEPLEIQSEAVSALTFRNSDDAAILLKEWENHSPALRSVILNRLLSRPGWTNALLDQIESGVVQRGELDASMRERLAKSANAEIKKRAGQLLAPPEDRAKVLARFRPALKLEGVAKAGRTIFEQRCATCHQFAGLGREIGPNLGAITNRTPEALFVSILDPNAAIEAKYGLYIAKTKSSQTHAGMVASETGVQITLLGADGVKVDLLRNDLAELKSTGISLMPAGLEADMTHQELADLIRFLQKPEEN